MLQITLYSNSFHHLDKALWLNTAHTQAGHLQKGRWKIVQKFEQQNPDQPKQNMDTSQNKTDFDHVILGRVRAFKW